MNDNIPHRSGVGDYDGTNPTTLANSLQKALDWLGVTIDWIKLV